MTKYALAAVPSRASGSAGMVRRSRCAREVFMTSTVLSESKPDVYAAITAKIIAAIESFHPDLNVSNRHAVYNNRISVDTGCSVNFHRWSNCVKS